jgi:RNA polymerase sigma factor (sigma-70 family)
MVTENPIRLMLVDDHAVVRSGLRILLEAEPDMVIVGEASTGVEAVSLARQTQPDVVVMDIAMPDMNGIEATRRIRAQCPQTAVLALTVHEADQYFFEMLNAGASGYVPKRAAPDDLVSAIRIVHHGEVFLYPSVAKTLVQSYLDHAGTNQVTAAPEEELTPREREVLTLIAEGLTNQEIADRLVLSVKTVDRHRENIMRKLKLHRRVDLVKYAIEKGLIELGE